MSHLSIERLAALADEQPAGEELAHLARCAMCAGEVEAHRSLLAMANSERDVMQLPLTRWDTLSRRLHAEGLISQSVGIPAHDASRGRFSILASRLPLQVAAALLLIAGGAGLGRVSTGAAFLPGGLSGEEPRTASADAIAPDAPSTFTSVDEAQRWKAFHSDAYQNAVSFLAANDSATVGSGTPAVMRTRLSALDRVSRTMQEALNDAPYDPVINDFYLNSFGQREAALRQLNAVLPQPVRLNSF